MMKNTMKTLVVLVIVLGVLGLDQWTKASAREALADAGTVSIFGDYLVLHLAHNSGAFLSLGASWSPLLRKIVFIFIPLIFLFVLMAVVLRSRQINRKEMFGFCMIIGGGLSNIGERFFNDGRVTDFINMGINDLRTGIFNLADFFVLAGVGVILLSYALRQFAGENH